MNDPTPRPPGVRLRPAAAPDLPRVLQLNHDHVDLLAPMDEDRATALRSWADRFDVIEVDARVAGFVITFAPGTAYDSVNYRWFAERFGSDFYYLDRVVVDPAMRRRGVGAAAYSELEATASAYERMALEVNTVPPNLPSLEFHRRRGYAEVGRLASGSGEVALLVKELTRGAGGLQAPAPVRETDARDHA